jgi:hypothetical protein
MMYMLRNGLTVLTGKSVPAPTFSMPSTSISVRVGTARSAVSLPRNRSTVAALSHMKTFCTSVRTPSFFARSI